MFISFFREIKQSFRKVGKKQRIALAAALVLGTGAVLFGSGPLLSYARVSTGVNGTASVGASFTPGESALGMVDPGFFVVQPMDKFSLVRAMNVYDGGDETYAPDQTLLLDQAETGAAVSIPDMNQGALLFVPKTTWNNETGKNGNNSAWWLRDSTKNYGRSSSRYNAWMIRMLDGDTTYSNSDQSDSSKYVHRSYNPTKKEYVNTSYFNNIVFCELTQSYLDKNSNKREIGSAAVTDKKFESIWQ